VWFVCTIPSDGRDWGVRADRTPNFLAQPAGPPISKLNHQSIHRDRDTQPNAAPPSQWPPLSKPSMRRSGRTPSSTMSARHVSFVFPPPPVPRSTPTSGHRTIPDYLEAFQPRIPQWNVLLEMDGPCIARLCAAMLWKSNCPGDANCCFHRAVTPPTPLAPTATRHHTETIADLFPI
jgi:hypothetical protein